MLQTFTTEDLETETTREAWRRYMGEVYFQLDVATDADAIIGQLRKSPLDHLHVSSFRANRQRIRRSKEFALKDKVESFCFVLPVTGVFTCRQNGKEQRAEDGDLYIVNASEVFEVDMPSVSEMVCLTIPCDLVRSRVPGVDDLCAVGNIADPVLSSTLRHMIGRLLEKSPEISSSHLEHLFVELIDAMIIRDGKALGRTSYSFAVAMCLLAKLRSVIQLNLHNQSFGLAQAAQACMVSTRHLQAVLQKQNTTFGHELIEARLVRAQRLLATRPDHRSSIGEIAGNCGFASQAHFASRYRERFGHPPSSESATNKSSRLRELDNHCARTGKK